MGDEFLLLDEPSIGTTVALMNSLEECFFSLNILNSTVWIIDTLRSIYLPRPRTTAAKPAHILKEPFWVIVTFHPRQHGQT
jgi:hypothetical protein